MKANHNISSCVKTILVTPKWESTTPNRRLAKVAVQCTADSFVVNQSLVLRITICGENRQLRQAPNRYIQWLRSTCLPHINYFYLPTFEFYITAYMQAKRKNNFRSTPNLITWAITQYCQPKKVWRNFWQFALINKTK